MSIGVNSDYQQLRLSNAMTRHTNNISGNLARLTSNDKLANIADAPATYAMSEKMRDRINATNAANENVQTDKNMLKVAESSISSTVELLRSLREKAIQASDENLAQGDRLVLAKEGKELVSQIERNSLVQWGNRYLLRGGTETIKPDYKKDDIAGTAADDATGRKYEFHVGPLDNQTAEVQIMNMTLSDLGLTGTVTAKTASAATDGVANVANANAKDYIEQSLKYLDASKALLDQVTFSDAGSTTKVVKGKLTLALEKAIENQSNIAAADSGLGYISDSLTSQVDAFETADANMREVDVAKEMSSYVRNTLLLQTTQFMMAQYNQNAYSVMNLLQ